MTYRFNIPKPVFSSDTIINKLIEEYSVSILSQNVNDAIEFKRYTINAIQQIEKLLDDLFTNIIIDFPILSDIHPMYFDLINLVIDDMSEYYTSLHEIARSIKDTEFIVQNYIHMFDSTNNPVQIKSIYKTIIGQVCSMIKTKQSVFNHLNSTIEYFQWIPEMDEHRNTCLIIGCNQTPHLKRQLFSVLVDSTFQQRSKMPIGHLEDIQVLLTYDVTNGPLESKETAECVTITMLSHLKTLIIWLFDFSNPVIFEQQVQIYQSMSPLFSNKSVVFVFNNPNNQPVNALCNIFQVLPKYIFSITDLNNIKEAILSYNYPETSLDESLTTSMNSFSISNEKSNVQTNQIDMDILNRLERLDINKK
ncbi:hypothetical protein DLAC_01547 [Tieghemostelium lacteum]|uniref:Uncharacterized protein n=1 Tax=Tieghemostelium lacteum TaxID=361077 RepID=A0A152A5P4_TIELA|nr:hypothetical protein DLAC_01547 [Tieghemostelium lacteum]|eukprot:KYR01554.1 hypothetical protein DLAC_01547 [Tieghemostelium lacteum]